MKKKYVIYRLSNVVYFPPRPLLSPSQLRYALAVVQKIIGLTKIDFGKFYVPRGGGGTPIKA